MDIIDQMKREMLRRAYSPRTIHTYIQCLHQFMKFYRNDLKFVKKVDLKAYLDKHVDKEHAGNTLNVHLNALKFCFEEILGGRELP